MNKYETTQRLQLVNTTLIYQNVLRLLDTMTNISNELSSVPVQLDMASNISKLENQIY